MYEFQDYITNTFLNNNKINNLNFKKKLIELSKNNVPIRNHYQLNYILKNYSKDKYILDYGCGSGLILAYLKLIGYKNIYGVDIREHKVRKFILNLLKFKDNKITLMKQKLPFSENKFDLVISNTVLEHVQDIENYLKRHQEF